MASPSRAPLPEALLKAASLVAKHKQQQQTLEKQEEQIQALTTRCDALKGIVEDLTGKLNTTLALLAQSEATGRANVSAMQTTVMALKDEIKTLRKQLEAQGKELDATRQQRVSQPAATAEQLWSDVTTESEGTRVPDDNEGATQQAFDAEETGDHSSESELGQVLNGNQRATHNNASLTSSERARFLDQFPYDVSTQLQGVFHKNVLTKADFEAARVAKTHDGPQVTASPNAGHTTPHILSSPLRRSGPSSASPAARAAERRDSREEQEAGSRSTIPGSPLVVHEDESNEQVFAAQGQDQAEEQRTASLVVSDPFPAAQMERPTEVVNDRRQSKRLRGRQPTFDGKTVDESPRDGLPRVPLAPVVNQAIKQGRKHKPGRQGGPTKAKKRKR